MWPKDPTPRYLPKRNGNNDSSYFINYSDKLETTLMSLWDEMVMWYVYTVECCTAVKMNELLIHTIGVDLRNRETGHNKVHTIWFRLHAILEIVTNPQRRKGDLQLPEGGGEVDYKETKGNF